MRITLVTAMTVAALAASVSASALAAPATISVTDGWFRSLPGGVPAGGYFTLQNKGKSAVSLTGAQSPACASLMLHMTHKMDGMEHMMEIAKADIPAGGETRFAPGGYHLMCMSPKLSPGTSAPVTLQFSDGSSLTASFAVRDAKGK